MVKIDDIVRKKKALAKTAKEVVSDKSSSVKTPEKRGVERPYYRPKKAIETKPLPMNEPGDDSTKTTSQVKEVSGIEQRIEKLFDDQRTIEQRIVRLEKYLQNS